MRVLVIGIVVIKVELSVSIFCRGHAAGRANQAKEFPVFHVRAMPGVIASGVILLPFLPELRALLAGEPLWVFDLGPGSCRKKVVIARRNRKKNVGVSSS